MPRGCAQDNSREAARASSSLAASFYAQFKTCFATWTPASVLHQLLKNIYKVPGNSIFSPLLICRIKCFSFLQPDNSLLPSMSFECDMLPGDVISDVCVPFVTSQMEDFQKCLYETYLIVA